MVPSSHVFPVLLLLTALQDSTSAIKCFVCSDKSPNCGDPFNKTALSPEICDPSTPVCLKEKFGGGGKLGGLRRSCISKAHCDVQSKSSTLCLICNTDLCNSSPKVELNLYVSLCVYSSLAFFFYM